MRERGGLVAVFAAFTAAAFHIGSVSTGPKGIPASVKAAGSSSYTQRRPPDEALRHTIKDFTKGEGYIPSPLDDAGTCLGHRPIMPGPKFDWIIAFVPDPEHSNLKLEFDRQLESIQLAAQNSDYQFERYWFPWRMEDADEKEHGSSIQFGTDSDGRLKAAMAPEEDSRREILPGILLFRRQKDILLKDRPLAVFLVGETPNSGIVPEQFRTAVCYGALLDADANGPPTGRELRILGPNFSGSLPSLAKLIEPLQSSKEFSQVRVRSWSSDRASQELFTGAFPDYVDFRTTRASSASVIKAFAHHAAEEWHDTNPIVILTEEGTAFGSGFSPNLSAHEQPIYRLNFPRNISMLRNATETDAHIPGFADDSKPQMPRNGITFSLKEDEHASSDVQISSKHQTPVSQESVLFAIGDLLKTSTVHYVGILASDPLDLLFLSRYLHSACPNLRIFTLDPDLLFEHGSDSADYTGIMALSTSPLFPMSQLWTGSKGKSLHAFASSTFEAVYNAETDLLLTLSGSPTHGRTADFRDYRDPFHERPGKDHVPPLWLTTVARGGYQPLDVLYAEHSDSMIGEAVDPPLIVPEYWPSWGYSFCLFIVCCVFYCFALTWARPRGGRTLAIFSVKRNEPNPMPRAFYLAAMGCSLCALVAIWLVVPGTILLEYFRVTVPEHSPHLAIEAVLLTLLGWAFTAVLPTLRLLGHRRSPSGNARRFTRVQKMRPVAATAGCSLGIFATYLYVLRPSSPAIPSSSVIAHLHFYFLLGCFAFAATLAASVRPLGQALKVRFSCSGRKFFRYGWRRLIRIPYVWGALALLLITVAIGGYSFFTVFAGHNDPVNFLAACRSLDLTSGVSPLVPVTLLLLSLSALAFVQLRRVDYYNDRYPRVPGFLEDTFCPELKKIVGEIRTRTRILSSHPAQFAAYAGVALLLAAIVNQPSHQTYENEALERLMLALPVAVGFLLLLVWIRFMIIWSTFSEFLQQLERHPLRHVFSLLPRDFIWSPVWQGGGKKRTHVAVTRSLECVLALQDHQRTSPTLRIYIYRSLPRFQSLVKRLLQISARRKRVPRSFSRILENKLVAIAEQATYELRRTAWSSGGYELKAELAKQEDTKEALHVERTQFVLEEPLTICGELVAYRLLAFINYVLWQLDNLVSYLSAGFLLLVIAMNSYDFRSGTIIDWILITLFGVMTVGIVAVFSQAARDAILSRISGTEEGKLDRHFFTHLISYGAMPVIVLAATHFPTVGRFFFSWVKPALEAIH